jgi:hypothetical protein
LLNAIAVLIMVTSGWQIYNASPIFGFEFPSALTLGGWLAGALLWHFAAMWLLVVNGLFYVTRSLPTPDPPPVEQPPPIEDQLERFLLLLFLRRYVTYCARRRRFVAMNGAAKLFAEVQREQGSNVTGVHFRCNQLQWPNLQTRFEGRKPTGD